MESMFYVWTEEKNQTNTTVRKMALFVIVFKLMEMV